MTSFVKQTIRFLSPILLCYIGLEIALRSIPNNYSLKSDFLNNHADKIESLILGSSHSLYGVDPIYFPDKAFNASHVSQSLDIDYEILLKYEGKFEQLKTLYLPISYFTMFSELKSSVENWRCKNYIIYYNMNLASQLKYHTETLSLGLNHNLKRLLSFIIKGKGVTCTPLGWGFNFHSDNAKNLESVGLISAQRHTYEINSAKYQDILHNNTIILKQILQWCKFKNIQVVLFTPPAFSSYRDELDPLQLQVTIESSKQMAKDYNNCTYLNLLADKNFNEMDFYDADHLSKKGAKKLSLKLINHSLKSNTY